MTKGYNVIIGQDIEELQDLVERFLADGWELAGGAVFVADRDSSGMGNGWAQTLFHPDTDRAGL